MVLIFSYEVWKKAPSCYCVNLTELEKVKNTGGKFQRVEGIDYICDYTKGDKNGR